MFIAGVAHSAPVLKGAERSLERSDARSRHTVAQRLFDDGKRLCLSVCLPVCLSVCLSFCPSLSESVPLSLKFTAGVAQLPPALHTHNLHSSLLR